jgi:hypothetical protein
VGVYWGFAAWFPAPVVAPTGVAPAVVAVLVVVVPSAPTVVVPVPPTLALVAEVAPEPATSGPAPSSEQADIIRPRFAL